VKKIIDNSSQRTIQENASRRLAKKLFPNEIWDTENRRQNIQNKDEQNQKKAMNPPN
jgi:hypothetical protein